MTASYQTATTIWLPMRHTCDKKSPAEAASLRRSSGTPMRLTVPAPVTRRVQGGPQRESAGLPPHAFD
jgi:hypothetical protein